MQCKHEEIVTVVVGNPMGDVSDVLINGETISECSAYPGVFGDGYGNFAVNVCTACLMVQGMTPEELRKELQEIIDENAEEERLWEEENKAVAEARRKANIDHQLHVLKMKGLGKLLKELQATVIEEKDPDHLILKCKGGLLLMAVHHVDGGIASVWDFESVVSQ